MMDLSVVIVSWNVQEYLAALLMDLAQAAGHLSWEAIVIDNDSADGSALMVRDRHPDIQLITNQENVGFARATNQGLAVARGEFVLSLNSDTRLGSDVLAPLVQFMREHPQAGACSPRLIRPDGESQPFAYGGDPTPGYLLRRGFLRLTKNRPIHPWDVDRPIQPDWVSGACLMVRRSVIDQIGGLDEQIFLYFEDVDWCLRIREAGFRVYYNPTVSVMHIGGASVNRNPNAASAYFASLSYFYKKHYGVAARAFLKVSLPVYRRLLKPA